VFKGAFAHFAFVGTFLRVDATMNGEVLLDWKRFVAVLTLIRFFSSVRPVMTCQSGWDCKKNFF
jgi:hypothetical protein